MKLSLGAIELMEASRSPAVEASTIAALVAGCSVLIVPTAISFLGTLSPLIGGTCEFLSGSLMAQLFPAAQVDCTVNGRVSAYPFVLLTQLALTVFAVLGFAVAVTVRARRGLARLEDFGLFRGARPTVRLTVMHVFFVALVAVAAYAVMATGPDPAALSGRRFRLATVMQPFEVAVGSAILLMAAAYAWLLIVGGTAAALMKVRDIIQQHGALR